MVMNANEFEKKEIQKLTEIKNQLATSMRLWRVKNKEMYRSLVSQVSKLFLTIG